jgi:hypothetical protein
MPLPKKRVGEALPLKKMSRGVAHSKTRDHQLPNPAVIQEPPLSKSALFRELLPRGPIVIMRLHRREEPDGLRFHHP